MELIIISLPLIVRGTLTTLYLSFFAIVLATISGFIFALFQLYGGMLLRTAVEIYLYIIRGVPLLVLLFTMYYAAPYAGVEIDPLTGGVVVIAAYFGAFMTEVFRGAVLSVPTGQWEAGKSIGLTPRKVLVNIVLQQAMRVAGPPYINTCIGVVKGTSLVAIIGLTDLTYIGRQIVERTLAPFEIFGFVALVYFVICFLLSRLGQYLERRFGYVN
ncbi:MAG: amino acid ABC transporter permease [Burkholderiaceae bacterium]|nr:amino acid ABC transporter permease [Burkholderiaceae bacterium]